MAKDQTRVVDYLGHPGLITVRETTDRTPPRPPAGQTLKPGDLVEIRTNQASPKPKAAGR